MTKTPVKFPKNRYKSVGGVTPTRYLSPVHSHCYIQCLKIGYVQLAKKVTKNYLRIIPKPHAYFQTMTKTQMKFQKNQYKAAGGVAPTRYPLSIHTVIIMPEKWLSSTCEKSDKKQGKFDEFISPDEGLFERNIFKCLV